MVKGCVCFVGSASCRAFGHTRPASLPGLSVGLPPLTKQGCLQSATQSHGTMQWHKWLTTCTGAPPLRPHFYQRYRFFDRLKHPVLSGCLLLFMLYFTRLRVCEISLFDLRSASAPYQCAVAVIQSELFINRCDVIHIDDIAPVASEKA